MPEIADILVAFGGIDQLVGQHKHNPAVIEVAERLLPGTTGFNQGWFSQIQRLFDEIARRRNPDLTGPLETLPSFSEALNSLATSPRTEELTFATPQVAKARYAATVLTELNIAIAGADADPEQYPVDPQLLAGVLGHNGAGTSIAVGEALAQFIQEEHPSNEGWYQFMDAAYDKGLVDADEVRIAPYQRGELRMVGDEICTQLDTPFSDDTLTVDDVKAILDPLNWKTCGAPYWESVVKVTSALNVAGWTRIHETVRPGPAIIDVALTTALMYRNQEITNGVVVNYDLDVSTTGSMHDGFVLVDQGYISVKKKEPTGVQLQTRKVARIQGLGVAALAVYAYAMGWSTVGENLLLTCARRGPDPSTVPWAVTQKATQVTPVVKRVPGIPEIKGEDRQKLIKKAVDAATVTVTRRSAKTSVLVRKWLDGKLQPGDLDLLTEDLGADLAEATGAGKAFVTFDDVEETP